jgi:hypothetical protein
MASLLCDIRLIDSEDILIVSLSTFDLELKILVTCPNTAPATIQDKRAIIVLSIS